MLAFPKDTRSLLILFRVLIIEGATICDISNDVMRDSGLVKYSLTYEVLYEKSRKLLNIIYRVSTN